MTASLSMSVFHQWLLADPSSQTSARAIILHGDSAHIDDYLIRKIADYLNEYDDDGDGCWLPATRELVDKILQDPNHRRLLGMDEGSDESAAEFSNTLTALSRRGHVVFRSPCDSQPESSPPNTFHAGVGNAADIDRKCHVILDPDLMEHKCIAHIIGDVFLEWLHFETRRTGPIQDIR